VLTVDFDLLGVKTGDVVLDAGCGEGRHSFEYIRRGARIFSMDMDMESLLKARYTLAFMQKNGQAHEEGRFLPHIGDALELPFKDETFDRIICSEVMEHVHDDNRACGEFRRVLKTGGTIAITVPTYITEMVYDALTYEYYSSPGGHIRRYVPRELAKIMEQNGLTVYGVRFKHSLHSVWWVIRSVVGLHNNDQFFTRMYRTFLTLGLYSKKFYPRAEAFFDNFFPKSIILYAVKK